MKTVFRTSIQNQTKKPKRERGGGALKAQTRIECICKVLTEHDKVSSSSECLGHISRTSASPVADNVSPQSMGSIGTLHHCTQLRVTNARLHSSRTNGPRANPDLE